MNIYLIGSLRNPEVPKIASKLREQGFEVFDDWYAAGEHADDAWRDYEKDKGHTYEEALDGYAAKHVFEFDYKHLERCDAAILALPAGKSGHLELGWAIGKGKRGYILLDSPDRWDVMYQFADVITSNFDKMLSDLHAWRLQKVEKLLAFTCARCGKPICDSETFVGDGNGFGQQFSHRECYYGE